MVFLLQLYENLPEVSNAIPALGGYRWFRLQVYTVHTAVPHNPLIKKSLYM
jgi:hypothetical protein